MTRGPRGRRPANDTGNDDAPAETRPSRSTGGKERPKRPAHARKRRRNSGERRPQRRGAPGGPQANEPTPDSIDLAPEVDPASEPPSDPFPMDDPTEDDDSELGIGSRVIPPAMHLFDEDDQDELAGDADDEADAGEDLPSSPYNRQPSSHSEMQATIAALEARLDGLIRQASEFADTEDAAEADEEQTSLGQSAEATRAVAERARPQEEDDTSVLEATRELLSSEYYRRQWGRLGLRRRAEHIDDFGHDPGFERRLLPLLNFLFQHYFRCETHGIEQVPADGRCVIVANHSGTLPLDGLMLRAALRLRHPSSRELRWLAEDFLFYLPFVGVFMNRLGAVRACQENAERLLSQEALLAAFPEGTKGVKKLYSERYQLQRFGRGGYIRLCLRTQSPLVPCAIVGAEETNPVLYRLEQVPRLLGWPYIPITPTFPALGPAGLLPAPTKWKMVFGAPMLFDEYGPADANDHVLVARLSDQVQAAIRKMLQQTLQQRQSVWLG